MLVLLLALPALAAPPEWVDRYECTQTNPMEAATFALHLAVDTRRRWVDHPIAVRLYDLETDTVRIRTRRPTRRPEYDLADPHRDAWHVGEDGIAEYLVLIPHRELREVEDEVHVTEVFGGGRAQWVNAFVCERRR